MVTTRVSYGKVNLVASTRGIHRVPYLSVIYVEDL